MTLREIYPFSTNSGTEYAVAGVSINKETSELEARIIYTARSADALGRIIGADYFSSAHGAPICYGSIPQPVSRLVPDAAPLTPQEREDFVEQFIKHTMPR